MSQATTPWTIAEAHRILDLFEDDYIIYNVTDWNEQDTLRIQSVLSMWEPSTVKTHTANGKTIIVRHPEKNLLTSPNAIHVFTKDLGTDVTIPDGETIESFIQMYLNDIFCTEAKSELGKQ
jgi:hypothetical protein